MKTDVWGKHMWYTIHLIALAYPENPTNEDKRNYQSFFENLHHVLPCYKCSINYLKHLNDIPISTVVLSNNENLFNWTVDIHNLVNIELSKKQWKHDEALEYYRNFSNNTENVCKKKNALNVIQFTLVCILILLLIIFLNRKRIWDLYCGIHIKNIALKRL